MIKASELSAHKSNSRIDALAEALGFNFVGGKYVKATRKYNHVEPVLAEQTKGRKKRGHFRKEMYDSFLTLSAGQSIDITDEVRGATLPVTKSRISTWGTRLRASGGSDSHYSVTRANGRIIVTRLN